MAKQGADGTHAKKAFSSRLMQMKFMKRGHDQAAVATVEAVQVPEPATSPLSGVRSTMLVQLISINSPCPEEGVHARQQVKGLPLDALSRMAWMLQEASDDAQWAVPDGGSRAGCRVIVEPDPPPGAGSGHMAFGGFNDTGSDKGQVDVASTFCPCVPFHATVSHSSCVTHIGWHIAAATAASAAASGG